MKMGKRLFDIVFSTVGLLIAAPIMAIIAIAIKLDSPGKIIFSQKRLGYKGSIFNLHKFRKFPENWGNKGPGVTVAGDARMTRIGRILERTKLDELPQLWNILKGEMSFVGPRPELLRYKHLFKDGFEKVLDYVPGIFGPNQVAFRNESALYPPDCDPEEFYKKVLFPQKAQNDIKYFENATFLSDLTWIIKGVVACLTGAIHWNKLLGFHLRVFLLDLFAIETAWIFSNFIRYGWHHLVDPLFLNRLLVGLGIYPAIILPIIIFSGCYKNPVRFLSFNDIAKISLSNIIGWCLASLVYLGFFYRNESILLVPLGISMLVPLSVLPRIWKKLYWHRPIKSSSSANLHKILIYGAGSRGAALANLLEYGFPNVKIIGFLDDAPKYMGRHVEDKKVIGCERDLSTVYDVHCFDELWVSFNPKADKMHGLQTWCKENKVRLVILSDIEPFARLF